MYALEPPYVDPYEKDFDKYKFIKEITIENMCKDILRKGDKTIYQDILDYMHEYIENNIEKFLPDTW